MMISPVAKSLRKSLLAVTISKMRLFHVTRVDQDEGDWVVMAETEEEAREKVAVFENDMGPYEADNIDGDVVGLQLDPYIHFEPEGGYSN